jgi:sec-independent protein translocase protein TatA
VLTDLGMGSFSIFHWMVVIVVLLLVFGPKRFADAAKGLGQALRGFKEELGKGGEDESHPTGDSAAKRLPGPDAGASPSASDSGKHDTEDRGGRSA